MRMLVLVAFIGGLFALISQFPLAWAAKYLLPSGQNFDWNSVHGTIWNGRFHRFESPFGISQSVVIQVNAAKVFYGKLPIQANGDLQGVNWQSDLGWRRFGNTQIRGHLTSLAVTDERLQGLQGRFWVELVALTFDRNGCLFADGHVSSDALTQNQARWHWQGPELVGKISCKDGSLWMDIAGKDANQQIIANLSVRASGKYSADIKVQTNHRQAAVFLPLYGFSKAGRTYSLREQGQWAYIPQK